MTSEVELDKHMAPPAFAKPIAGLDAKEGSLAHFEVVVAGQPLPQVTWFREGHQIVPSKDFQVRKEGNKHQLIIQKVMKEDAGIFTCRATNPAGAAECSGALFVERMYPYNFFALVRVAFPLIVL